MSNVAFLKSLPGVASRVGSFQNKNQRMSSMRRHLKNTSEAPLCQCPQSIKQVNYGYSGSKLSQRSSRKPHELKLEQKNSNQGLRDSKMSSKKRSKSSEARRRLNDSNISGCKSEKSIKTQRSSKSSKMRNGAKTRSSKKLQRVSSATEKYNRECFMKRILRVRSQQGSRERNGRLMQLDSDASSKQRINIVVATPKSNRSQRVFVQKYDDEKSNKSGKKGSKGNQKLLMYREILEVSKKLNQGIKSIQNIQKGQSTHRMENAKAKMKRPAQVEVKKKPKQSGATSQAKPKESLQKKKPPLQVKRKEQLGVQPSQRPCQPTMQKNRSSAGLKAPNPSFETTQKIHTRHLSRKSLSKTGP